MMWLSKATRLVPAITPARAALGHIQTRTYSAKSIEPSTLQTPEDVQKVFPTAPDGVFVAPYKFWANKSTHRPFFDWAMRRLGLKNMEDWYKVKQSDLNAIGGVGLIRHYYKQSLTAALKTNYPEHNWQIWHFTAVPRGWWDDAVNIRDYFDWAARELDIKQREQWYQVSAAQILKLKGYALMLRYKYDISNALSKAYPDHEFLPWRFEQVPTKWWRPIENQRRCLDWVAKELGFRKMNDWYGASLRDVRQLIGNRQLLRDYGGSLANALQSVYSNHEWHPWLFNRAVSGTMFSLETQRLFFDWAGQKLGHSSLEGWYTTTLADIHQFGGHNFIIRQYKSSLAAAVMAAYPEHKWDALRFVHASAEAASRKQLQQRRAGRTPATPTTAVPVA